MSKPVWVAALGVGAGLLWLLVAPFIFLAVGLAYVYIRIFVGPLDVGPHPPDRWGLPTGRVTAAQVAAHPEARLYYPGARIVTREVAAQYYDAFSGGEHAATAETVLLVRATPAQVTSWYMRWLSARGWRQDSSVWAGQDFNTVVSAAHGSREHLAVGVWYRDEGYVYGPPPSGWTRINVYYSIQPYKA